MIRFLMALLLIFGATTMLVRLIRVGREMYRLYRPQRPSWPLVKKPHRIREAVQVAWNGPFRGMFISIVLSLILMSAVGVVHLYQQEVARELAREQALAEAERLAAEAERDRTRRRFLDGEKGMPGPPGVDGKFIVEVRCRYTGQFRVLYRDGTYLDAGECKYKGPVGPPGEPAVTTKPKPRVR